MRKQGFSNSLPIIARSPNVKRRLSDEHLIKKFEDSCEEKARRRREVFHYCSPALKAKKC